MIESKDNNSGVTPIYENRTSPEETDTIVKVIDINSWIALSTVFAVLVGCLVWLFFGTMLIREEVSGVMVKSGKIVNIHAEHDGSILDLSVISNEYVIAGEVIARIRRPELTDRINQLIMQGAPQAEINLKRTRLIQESQIITPENGRVVDIFVHDGNVVKKGDLIATISKEVSEKKAMEGYLFVSPDQFKNIRKGMTVNVFPANINSEIYGNMTGIVTWIGEYPVTENYLFNLLGSRELAQEFLKGGAAYEVYISLITSEETVTGYAWTTSYGPPNKFGDITLFDASVIVEKVRPLDLFFSR
jgi:hypothetical protein